MMLEDLSFEMPSIASEKRTPLNKLSENDSRLSRRLVNESICRLDYHKGAVQRNLQLLDKHNRRVNDKMQRTINLLPEII